MTTVREFRKIYVQDGTLEEDIVWYRDIAPFLGEVPENIRYIWQYSFTEMFNNALEHSQGKIFHVLARHGEDIVQILIYDDGVGIFKKLQKALNLPEERFAVLELAKGKLTTDPDHHSGEGIFFTSRMLTRFSIRSGGVYFSHDREDDRDWILEAGSTEGTSVFMELRNDTLRTDKEVFDEYVSGEDYGFTKTVVPVKLAQYGNDRLISRSQAKRLLARVDRFETVLFDFEGVSEIGQSFADQIFRVFAKEHPNMTLLDLNASTQVKQMISRALKAAD